MLANRYRIIGLLGQGGMSEVYRANDLKLGQPVALKFLLAAAGKNQQLLDRWHAEVRFLRIEPPQGWMAFVSAIEPTHLPTAPLKFELRMA